jgi:multidrug efflux pump subunit AcrB
MITFALRRPITIVVGLIAILLGSGLALRRMDVDLFPSLDLPVIYVCQPYGGMDPAQMEGLIANYYEYHFLYISGIHHVESRNVQGMSLMKLSFHPGTNMAQAMAETITYVNRSRAFMPTGTVPPFVMRFDTGSVPVGYLVLSSETKTLAEIQDQALFKVRPMFASLPGVSAPPPFGGSQRTVVVRVDPDRLRAYEMSPDDVVNALATGNAVTPSGNVHIGDKYPIVPSNAIAPTLPELGEIPLPSRPNAPGIYLRDIATIEDSSDIPTGYSLVNGRRAIYILVTKRADASTLNVVNEVRRAMPRMQESLPEDIRVSFEFDQSPYVTRAMASLGMEGLLGAFLTGLMVLVFLRDWRSALIVVLNIPFAILAAVIAIWLTGETINIMTLGGLALAIGILVDEATVEIENIHSQGRHAPSIAWAVRAGNAQTAIPRLLSMLCILAVFIPSFFMEGAARSLFAPLSFAVGFAMIASYLLSNTFVPVAAVWLLRANPSTPHASSSSDWRDRYGQWIAGLVSRRGMVVGAYSLICLGTLAVLTPRLGIDIFPVVDSGQFRLRLRAPDGTHFEATEKLAIAVLEEIKETVGADHMDKTLGYVGTVPSSYPINAVYQWSRGPEEAILRVAIRRGSGQTVEAWKERLRKELEEKFPEVRFSFEPGDIVSEVMSFGSPTPIEIAVSGATLAENRAYLERVRDKLASMAGIRDLQFSQSLDFPAVSVKVDRQKAGTSGATTAEIARSMLAATSSSRFVVPVFWPDPKTGIGYQVQVEIPQAAMASVKDLELVPVKRTPTEQLLLRDVAQISEMKVPGQFDRYNMKREISLTANLAGLDLGRASRDVEEAIQQVGALPKGAVLQIRGLIPTLREMISGLSLGLGLAVLVIFLLLSAHFQSFRLALITISTVPAVLVGVVMMLSMTGDTINIQSFIGAIMAIGVGMANAILLVTFSRMSQQQGATHRDAAILGGKSRVRAVVMTSLAMTAGMLPMALALGESGEQTASLGRAVIGGLLAATLATLFVLPMVFAIFAPSSASNSLDPTDPESSYFRPDPAKELGLS